MEEVTIYEQRPEIAEALKRTEPNPNWHPTPGMKAAVEKGRERMKELAGVVELLQDMGVYEDPYRKK